ncbi:MAG: hypothetical protein K0R38_6947 [Polyangiaceae bacterium]|jgi:hypothetical protein|nr:hypothetical protein [Polyangiaceae bacterium]
MQPFLALVDYYNQVPLPGHRDATFEEHRAGLEAVTAKLAAAVRAISGPAELRVRLYGGWFIGGQDEESADRGVVGTLARRDYPTRIEGSRVFVELADAMLTGDGQAMGYTVREQPGMSPFKMRWPLRACSLTQGNCSLHDLDCWRKGRCPRHKECGLAVSDVTFSRRQKLVDSMIVADTIEASLSEGWVAAVSNDDDIVPGVLTAAGHSRKVALFRFGRLRPSPYDGILAAKQLLPLE